MKTISDAENPPEDEGVESSTTDTDSPELGNVDPVSSDAVLQTGVINGEPAVGNPMKRSTELEATPGSEPERVYVPDVSGGSVEEAARSLSEAGYVVLGTAVRHSSEPAGMAVGTDLPTRFAVERGTPVFILVSSGPAGQEAGKSDEDAAPTPAPEAPPAPRQLSKTGKRDPKALTATFAKGEPVSAIRPSKVAAYSSSAQAIANQR
jgi:beta-lactam-binding protein with PASTA domain